MTAAEKIHQAVAALRQRTGLVPEVGIVLGSGLGEAAVLESLAAIPYGAIPHWRTPSVAGHRGELVLGRLGGRTVAVLRGRLHLYEGYTPQEVTFPVRVLAAWGARTLVLTNAAGGLDPSFRRGDLMLLADHINFTGANPLVGPPEESLGAPFVDMTGAYDPALRALALRAAQEQGLALRQGVYIGVLGPSYETPAELAMFRAWGAHAVGMSTVHESIVARHAGMRVLGIAVITNTAPGGAPEPVGHEAVLQAAREACPRLARLLEAVVREMPP